MKPPECEYCKSPLPLSKKKRRFCPPPKTCRQKWHHENTAPGIVTGVRQLMNPPGAWSVTVRYPNQPEAKIGDRVLVEKADICRPEPSQGVESGNGLQDDPDTSLAASTGNSGKTTG